MKSELSLDLKHELSNALYLSFQAEDIGKQVINGIMVQICVTVCRTGPWTHPQVVSVIPRT